MHATPICDVSILVPAKNASNVIDNSIATLHQYFSKTKLSFEIIVIVNGKAESPQFQSTLKVAETMKDQMPELRILPYTERAGKGAALQAGFQISRGNWIYFIDADIPYDLSFFDLAQAHLEDNCDLVIGNRRSSQSIITAPILNLPKIYFRHQVGQVYNWLVRLMFGLSYRDTQAGIRAMSRRFANLAFGRQTCPSFFFDVEHFLVAKRNYFSISEIPLHLRLQDNFSTINVTRELPRALLSLAKIFRKDFSGHYRGSSAFPQFFSAPSWKTRLFLRLRQHITPYEAMAQSLPQNGKILDMGCGHGLFSSLLAALHPNAKILGIDHDKSRVQAAQSAAKTIPNLQFESGEASASLPDNTFDGAALIDVLHYLGPKEQRQTLENIKRCLKDNGVLIVREVDNNNSLTSRWNRFYEFVSVKIGITKSRNSSSHFRSSQDWMRLLDSVGFSVSAQRCSHPLFSDVLFVAKKEQSNIRRLNSPLFSADDWGLSPGVNWGILELAKAGVIQQVSIMSDAPFVNVGLDELKQQRHVRLGLHFNLTHDKKFAGPGKLLFKSLTDFSAKSRFRNYVREQLESQLNTLEQLGVRVSHIDGHHHIHVFPGIIDDVIGAATSKNIRNLRLPLDKKLWNTRRFPLVWLSNRAQKKMDLGGLRYNFFLYPQSEHFANASVLNDFIQSSPDSEIIVHPAETDDLHVHSINDTYTTGRVREYQTLMDWSKNFKSKNSEASL